MATYYDPIRPSQTRPRQPICDPPQPRYDPVTEISPRIPRVPTEEDRPVGRVTRQPSQGSSPPRSLPGLSELFASRLLVAPSARKDRSTPASIAGILDHQPVNATHPQLPAVQHEPVVSPSRYAATPALSSSVPTSPDSWTSELPPLQDAHMHSLPYTHQANPRSPAFQSQSFGASVVGGHSSSWTPDYSAPRQDYGLPPNHHNDEVQVHWVDSRAGWRESDLRPAVPELLPATYMYRTDCGMISGPQSHPDYPVGFSVPGRDDLVYPMWDLTKRKLPRKRMSTACTDCRKKKIRCEPGVGGCLQCRKVQKPCVIEPVKLRRRKKALPSDADAEPEESDNGAAEELHKSCPS